MSRPPDPHSGIPFAALGLRKSFGVRGPRRGSRRSLRALRDVSFLTHSGSTLGVIGATGSGKTTLVRAALHLIPLDAGEVRLGGEIIDPGSKASLRAFRRQVQVVFQDPMSSLDPRWSVGDILLEGPRAHRTVVSSGEASLVADLLQRVGLEIDAASFQPHAFSGGERQRIAVARALALAPTFLVLDEPVASLDPVVRGQVVDVLRAEVADRGTGLILVSHDVDLVRGLADRVMVLFGGMVMETFGADQWSTVAHPYTQDLLSASDLSGAVAKASSNTGATSPAVAEGSEGCPFAVRCPWVQAVCQHDVPALRALPGGGEVACHAVAN